MNLTPLKDVTGIDFKFTQHVSDYRNNTSVNTPTAEALKEKLMPTTGTNASVHGALLAAVLGIYDAAQGDTDHDMAEFEDNGYDCDHCDYYDIDDPDTEHEEVCLGDYVLTDTYQEHFDLLKKWMPEHSKDIDLAITTITSVSKPRNPPIIFDRLIDHVIHTILTTKDQAVN